MFAGEAVEVHSPPGVAAGKPELDLAKQAGGELEGSRGRQFAGEAVQVYSPPGVAAGKPELELAKQASGELEVSLQAELELPLQALRSLDELVSCAPTA
jgi:hypothetical protein